MPVQGDVSASSQGSELANHIADELVRHHGIRPLNLEEKRAILRMEPRDLYAPDAAQRIRQMVKAMQNEDAKPT
jgi:hypothetical protein